MRDDGQAEMMLFVENSRLATLVWFDLVLMCSSQSMID